MCLLLHTSQALHSTALFGLLALSPSWAAVSGLVIRSQNPNWANSLNAGSYVPVEVSPVAGTSSNVLKQQLHMQLPAGLSRGSVQVEVVRGGFISRSKVLGCLCLAVLVTIA